MKKLALIITAAMMFSSCGSDGFSDVKCRQAIIEELKTVELQRAPDVSWRYIARLPDGSVWWVECLGGEAKITAKMQLFPPKT